MEKISLLLLLVKKTLIGTAIGGILSLSGFASFFNNGTDANKEKEQTKYEKRISVVPPRDGSPRRM